MIIAIDIINNYFWLKNYKLEMLNKFILFQTLKSTILILRTKINIVL